MQNVSLVDQKLLFGSHWSMNASECVIHYTSSASSLMSLLRLWFLHDNFVEPKLDFLLVSLIDPNG